MSRSGYNNDYGDYDYDQWAAIRWSGAVKSAMRGKRGQQFLKDILAAMDAMPEKRLVRNVLVFDGSGDPTPPRTDPYGHNSYYGDPVIVGGDQLYDINGNTCNVGDCCAMGALAKARGLDISNVDPEDPPQVAALFKVNDKIVREIADHNDEHGHVNETPEARFIRMRAWIAGQILETKTDG